MTAPGVPFVIDGTIVWPHLAARYAPFNGSPARYGCVMLVNDLAAINEAARKANNGVPDWPVGKPTNQENPYVQGFGFQIRCRSSLAKPVCLNTFGHVIDPLQITPGSKVWAFVELEAGRAPPAAWRHDKTVRITYVVARLLMVTLVEAAEPPKVRRPLAAFDWKGV